MLAAFGGISKDIKAPSAWPTSVMLPGDVRFGFFRGVIVARLGAADRARAVAADQAHALRQDRARRRRRPRHGLGARHQRAARLRRRVLPRRAAGRLRRRARRHDDLARSPARTPSFLLNSLIVVIIGGMGSLGGAAIGALALGLVDAYADVYLDLRRARPDELLDPASRSRCWSACWPCGRSACSGGRHEPRTRRRDVEAELDRALGVIRRLDRRRVVASRSRCCRHGLLPQRRSSRRRCGWASPRRA